MAYWNGQKVIRYPPKLSHYPRWLEIDCGCCTGLKWGTDSPVDCDICKGGGTLFQHIKSGALALWPGGPFAGTAIDCGIKK